MRYLIALLTVIPFTAFGQGKIPFTCTPLTEQGDLSGIMVEQVDRFLMKKTEEIRRQRSDHWHPDFASEQAFARSVAGHREWLKDRLGVVEQRVPPKIEMLNAPLLQPFEAGNDRCTIQAVRWNVLEGLSAEGLLLRPRGQVLAQAVLIPDAAILPEVFAGLQGPEEPGYGVARKLAEAGWEVLIPVLVSRQDTFSGNPSLKRFTNQPHREWIYRQAYEVGRHVIGYELQKVFSAIDWFTAMNRAAGRAGIKIGVAGYGEGGLLALYAAALDPRISSTLVSGYFNAREQMWGEPIYRNVFGLLDRFGDAELAAMAWPRTLTVEHAIAPEVSGPPAPSKGRQGAAPGTLGTPDFADARAEWERAAEMLPPARIHLRWYADGNAPFRHPFSPAALAAFSEGLDQPLESPDPVKGNSRPPETPLKAPPWIDAQKRQERTVRDMERHIQQVLAVCERTRNENFWEPLHESGPEEREQVRVALRGRFREQIGRLPAPDVPANPKARMLERTAKWTSYEVVLDVWPGIFAWGTLLIPNDLSPGEERPAVVCQHGLEGLPSSVITTDPESRAFKTYKGFAAKLAEKGYVTFAPFNLYRGGDKFRVLQRKANPLGLSLFSIIIGQHQRIVEWLGQLPFVDAGRIGFYGLSYGGKTAMRVPPVVEGYALSICSGDFNEWVRKCTSTQHSFSYMFTGEYEMPEWDLGHTFNYAEMAALIAPRPFMVERGHDDRVATDEWVGYEFEKVRRHYDQAGLSGSVGIEYFPGPHSIHGVGTFEFLDRHLGLSPGEEHREQVPEKQ